MPATFQKKSMDAVNEALLKPTEYPAADKTYNHPMWFKGTEPESIRTGSIDVHTDPKVLPPRRDMRSMLDEDVKAEIKADKPEKAASASSPCRGCGEHGSTCSLCGQRLARCGCDKTGACKLCGRAVRTPVKQATSKRGSRFTSPLFTR